MRSILRLLPVSVLAVSAVACGGAEEAGRSPDPVGKPAVGGETKPAKAVASYRVTSEKGRLRFEPLTKGQTVKVNGFDLDAASLFTFDTPKYCNGANPGDTGSDCSFSSPSCGSSQVCADVTVQYTASGTSNVVANTWIELRDYKIDGVADAGNNVRLSASTDDAVLNQLTGKLDSSRDHRNYGQLTSGAAATSKRWDFDMGGGIDPSTQTFSFTVDVYTTFTHTSYSVTETDAVSWVDACALGGTVLSQFGNGDVDTYVPSAGNVELPFPIVIFERSDGWVRVSENGVICLHDNSVAIQCSSSPTNKPLPANNLPTGSAAAAPFWDDLDIEVNATSKICAATTGAAGSRQFTVSWLDMADVNGTGTETISVTAIFREDSDDIEFLYKNPGTISTFTRGVSATAGLQHRTGASTYWTKEIWSNTAYLASASGSYAQSKKLVAQ